MENEEVMRLLLAERVLDLAIKRRRGEHSHIQDPVRREQACLSAPIEPHVKSVLADLRTIDSLITGSRP